MKPKPPERPLPAEGAGLSSGTVTRVRFSTEPAPHSTTSSTPARQSMALRSSRKAMGAVMAPTANTAWSRFEAAALPPVMALTVPLLKLETLPRPTPVSMNAKNSSPGAPFSVISSMPRNASADRQITVRLRPM